MLFKHTLLFEICSLKNCLTNLNCHVTICFRLCLCFIIKSLKYLVGQKKTCKGSNFNCVAKNLKKYFLKHIYYMGNTWTKYSCRFFEKKNMQMRCLNKENF